jgi:hypothetical protein
LTGLPALPNGLNLLKCDNNQLTGLPTLPSSIQTLTCTGNPNLSCLPYIYPNLLTQFLISGTGIHCIPNSFSAQNYDINPATLPLCSATSGCDFYYNITGNVHNDTSLSCAYDSFSPGAPVTNLKVQLIRNGQVVQQFYTFNSGNYSFRVDTFTNYSVTIDTIDLPLSVACPSYSQNVSLSIIDSVVRGLNFGMQCSSLDYATLYIQGNHFRPSYTTTVNIGAGNLPRVLYNADCGSAISGSVTTILNGSIGYAGPAAGALTPSSVSGNVLTYNIANLDLLVPGSLDIVVLTDTGAIAGSDVCFTTIVIPSIPDVNLSDDTLKACFPIVNSWDPNSKFVTPAYLPESASWLTYTIEFQNTGSDTAYLVIVKDTLSQYVDASSFQYIASDHKPVIQINGNVVTFTFPHINLVDNGTNPSLSTGWIQYRVRSKANLPINTQVNNTAYIYFDNNMAVVTNTATSTVGVNGVAQVSNNSSIHLYPNPNKGSFTLQTSGSINTDYTISDMLGHIITQQSIRSDNQQIDLPEAAEGVYTLSVKGAQPIRFVIVR